ENEVSSLALEFRGKGTALFGHLTPRSGEHSRLNECPVSLDHYTQTPASRDGQMKVLISSVVMGFQLFREAAKVAVETLDMKRS
ncbi:hypothetical protein NLO93_27245, partial [Pseudomonas savastanoi]|uniref:hypothetical protein n=1 Tax=Pseudomonas savastanoi TaxID=29438 RepID=UPI00210D234F